jgi:hypothetical protein
MKLNDPVLLAEVTEAFHAYERALMTDDIAAMDALFHDAETTNRIGVGEVLFGISAIREFRKGRGGSPQRRLGRVEITVYGEACATVDAEFFRENSTRRGRQSQSWVKFGAGDFGGWKVVSAHVSLEGDSH